MAEGDRLRIRGPRNHFSLVDAPTYLFIAGGIGITPILSMVAGASRAGRAWSLLYGGRSRTSMAFVAEFDPHGPLVALHPEDELVLLDLDRAVSATSLDKEIYACAGLSRCFVPLRRPSPVTPDDRSTSSASRRRLSTRKLERVKRLLSCLKGGGWRCSCPQAG